MNTTLAVTAVIAAINVITAGCGSSDDGALTTSNTMAQTDVEANGAETDDASASIRITG